MTLKANDDLEQLTRAGVVVERTAAHVRVVVPPVAGWRSLPRGYLIAVVGLIAWMVLPAVSLLGDPQVQVGDLLPALIMPMIALLLVLFAAHRRLVRRLVVHVDGERLILSEVAGRSRRQSIWRRAAPVEVRMNRGSGKLMVCPAGEESVEYFCSYQRAVTESLAELLNDALRRPFDANAPLAPVVMEETMSPAMRKGLVMAAIVMASLGVGLLFAGPWAPFGVLIIVLAGAPAGVALGTQRKDYYFC
ncbi:MAG TPA: hypothetical protein VF669_04930 [Tepidisphaeraceae bacterium]|jgi:hypothetical protein